jgi:hypothetical protein
LGLIPHRAPPPDDGADHRHQSRGDEIRWARHPLRFVDNEVPQHLRQERVGIKRRNRQQRRLNSPWRWPLEGTGGRAGRVPCGRSVEDIPQRGLGSAAALQPIANIAFDRAPRPMLYKIDDAHLRRDPVELRRDMLNVRAASYEPIMNLPAGTTTMVGCSSDPRFCPFVVVAGNEDMGAAQALLIFG